MQPTAQPTQAPKDLVDLKTVIKKVQDALDEYQTAHGGDTSPLPALESAEFDFKTTVDVVLGFGINFWIIKLGATHTQEVVHQVTFTYEPPKPPGLESLEPQDLKDALAQAIEAAAIAVQNSDTDALKFKKLAVSINFGVKWDGNGGVSIPVSLVTIGPNVDISKNSVHSVKVTFGKSGDK